MSFSPTVAHPSSAVPGVTFTVHRIGFGRRTDIDFETLKLRQRLRELEADHPPRSDREKELAEQLAIANKKALAVPAEDFAKVMQADVDPLAKELEAVVPAETKKRRAVLNEEYVMVENQIQAAWIRRNLIAIEHRVEGGKGELDGMAADELLDHGPPALAIEIYEALTSDGKLKDGESKNSPPPTTSGERADGQSRNTTAESAEALRAAGT